MRNGENGAKRGFEFGFDPTNWKILTTNHLGSEHHSENFEIFFLHKHLFLCGRSKNHSGFLSEQGRIHMSDKTLDVERIFVHAKRHNLTNDTHAKVRLVRTCHPNPNTHAHPHSPHTYTHTPSARTPPHTRTPLTLRRGR